VTAYSLADGIQTRGSAMGQLVRDVMTTQPLTVPPHTSVTQASFVMHDRGIGDVMITDGSGMLVGILTDRDIVTRVIAQELDPVMTPVEDVLTRTTVTVTPDDDTERVLELMRGSAIRRVPVVAGDGVVVGIVSLGDLATAGGVDSTLADISDAAPSS
jgi:CBS domain-containing protein